MTNSLGNKHKMVTNSLGDKHKAQGLNKTQPHSGRPRGLVHPKIAGATGFIQEIKTAEQSKIENTLVCNNCAKTGKHRQH